MVATLTLPVAGKDYTIPSPSIKVGIVVAYIQATLAAKNAQEDPPEIPEELDEAEVVDLIRRLDRVVLGPAWPKMLADDVPISEVDRAVQATVMWIVSKDEERARAVMDGGGSGPKASTTTAAESTTQKRASSSGTKSRTKKST